MKVSQQQTDVKEESATDGRRLRTKRNRQKVIAAMLEIVKEGNFSPNAEEVAAKAGVGIRSVFRYFDDMESLVQEMVETVEAEVLPIASRKIVADTLENRIEELIDLRIEFFERAMPFKIASSVKRYGSEKLMACYERDLELLRGWLADALPEHIVDNRIQFEAIDVTLSFDTWRRLRQEQKLNIQEGRLVLNKMMNGILKHSTA